MSDKFTEITTKSWGSRILNSIKGVFIGFIMFIISFGLLYYNEGRVDISKIAGDSIEIQSNTQTSIENDNKLVSITGILESNDKIGDEFLRQGNYISIERSVEMYSWKEYKESNSKTNVGGSETTETTYNYKKEWVNDPDNSSNFKITEGHQNPQMTINNNSVKVQNAKIGIYDLDINKIKLPNPKSLKLNNENIILINNLNLANDKYLFKGTGTIENPQIGDIRISYSVITNPLEKVTVFGKLDKSNQKISQYFGKNNVKLYSVFEGNKDTAISIMNTEHNTLTWALRGLGFILMWIGLMTLFNPISVFLDILPIFGSISRIGIALITFFVSLVLSIITILISILTHNLITLIVVILFTIVALILYLKSKRK